MSKYLRQKGSGMVYHWTALLAERADMEPYVPTPVVVPQPEPQSQLESQPAQALAEPVTEAVAEEEPPKLTAAEMMAAVRGKRGKAKA